jgi:hypothetical protein
LNLRPLGPQPSALPDCATPRGVIHFDGSAGAVPMGTSVRLYMFAIHGEMLALQEGEARRGIRLAAPGAGAEGYLLPTLSRRVQAGALPGEQRALHRRSWTAQQSPSRRTDSVLGCFSTRASLRRLRRERSHRARVRPSSGQEVRDRKRHPRSQLARRPRRDCKVRGRLCKLSSTSHREAGRLHPRGGSSMVEPQSSKLATRVQFPSAALLQLN